MNTNTHRETMMKKQSGFTLIEVMIALVVLAAGILALATMQIVSIRSNAFSTEMTYATMLAQTRLEAIRNMDYDDVTAVGQVTLPVDPTTKGIAYRVERLVQDDTPAPDMKRITLRVSWTGTPAGSAEAEPTADFMATFTTVVKR